MSAPAEKPARGDNPALLGQIGALIRNERAKRGMTRRALAEQCQTSERYLAQIEGGAGNPSVLVLDAIARALDVDPVDLMPPRRRTATGPQSADRAQRIALIGLRGAGKSTLGAELAQRLGAPFVEIDKMIEREHGAPVATLFEVYGQATFRRYERECLARIIAQHDRAVIATAGGIVADEQTFAQLLDRTHVIWLQASPAEHMQRVMEQGDFRPMDRNRDAMQDLVAILNARAAAYGRAHARLNTSGRALPHCVDELTLLAAQMFASA
ncbi:MAG: helix-turn-helix domain-containing protein [Alphaproteobacteria bacterium]|nr:helix-turn-helix domain-containing protein [Alphaproteobacteria bacterium]